MRLRYAPPRSRRRRLAIFVAVAATLACVGYLAGLGGLDSDTILNRRTWLATQAAVHPVSTAALFCLVYVVGMSLALPLGGMLGLLAGFLFGRWPGLGLVVVAGTCSAALVLATVRRITGERPVGTESPLARLADGMRTHGFACVLAMRIVPAFPFFVVTLVAALAGVRWRSFLAATIIGKIPASLIYTGLGETLGQAGSLGDVVTSESIVGLTCLGVLALVPLAYRLGHRRLAARRKADQAASRAPSPIDSRSAPVSAS